MIKAVYIRSQTTYLLDVQWTRRYVYVTQKNMGEGQFLLGTDELLMKGSSFQEQMSYK